MDGQTKVWGQGDMADPALPSKLPLEVGFWRRIINFNLFAVILEKDMGSFFRKAITGDGFWLIFGKGDGRGH